jgi:oxygen-independent coproporphyrinogen-3 oxidase
MSTFSPLPSPLSIYIHWPFCASLCPYCDFNSHLSKNIDHDAWAAAYISELKYWHEQVPDRNVMSIFWGGGTPSLMAPKIVEKVLGEIRALWRVDENCEITLEANPGSTDAAKLKDFRAAGINRVSIGVQSLNDDALKFLGRKHKSAEGLTALKTAQGLFERVSADFIYALAGQSVADWQTELRTILDLNLDHLSLYQLTLEPSTPFYNRAQSGEVMTANESDSAEMFEITQNMCGVAALPAYEISNHARAGQESRHNLAYWQYDDYLGIGPGAHGRVTLNGANGQGTFAKHATTTHRAPAMYLKKVVTHGHALHPIKPVAAPDALREMLMMGLRLMAGIPKSRIELFGGKKFAVLLPPEVLQPFVNEGLLWQTENAIGATADGAVKLNALTKAICARIAA